MNGHLNDERLMELALDPAVHPQNGEATHLQSCTECAAKLELERELTCSILELAPVKIPETLARGALDRYRAATRARNLRQVGVGVAILFMICTPTIVLLIKGWSEALGSLGVLAGEIAALASASFTVMSSAPLISLTVIAVLCLTAFAGCGLLAGLARNSRDAKYLVARDVPPSGDAR